MIEKRTTLSSIEPDTNGYSVAVRLALEFWDDTTRVTSKWHRTAFEPQAGYTSDQIVDAQLAAVADHLASDDMGGYPPLGADDTALIKLVVAQKWDGWEAPTTS